MIPVCLMCHAAPSEFCEDTLTVPLQEWPLWITTGQCRITPKIPQSANVNWFDFIVCCYISVDMVEVHIAVWTAHARWAQPFAAAPSDSPLVMALLNSKQLLMQQVNFEQKTSQFRLRVSEYYGSVLMGTPPQVWPHDVHVMLSSCAIEYWSYRGSLELMLKISKNENIESGSSVSLALMLEEFGVVFDTGSGNIVRRLSLSGSSMIFLFSFDSSWGKLPGFILATRCPCIASPPSLCQVLPTLKCADEVRFCKHLQPTYAWPFVYRQASPRVTNALRCWNAHLWFKFPKGR